MVHDLTMFVFARTSRLGLEKPGGLVTAVTLNRQIRYPGAAELWRRKSRLDELALTSALLLQFYDTFEAD